MKDSGFRHAVLRKVRRMESARGGAQRFWAGLALVGSVGWMIALPMVGGAFLGRWLDETLATGLALNSRVRSSGSRVNRSEPPGFRIHEVRVQPSGCRFSHRDEPADLRARPGVQSSPSGCGLPHREKALCPS